MTIDPKLMAQLTDSPTRISVEKLIGTENFEKLSYELGGRRLHIAKNPTEGSALAVCIGMDAARKMAEVWGAMEYDIPVLEGREVAIKKMLEAGIAITRVSAYLKISIRTVRRVANKKQEEKQLFLPMPEVNAVNLFDQKQKEPVVQTSEEE